MRAFVLVSFPLRGYRPDMTDDSEPVTAQAERLTPASPDDLTSALAFALRFEGRKRKHDADAFMAEMVAKRLVRYLERAGFVVMKRSPIEGSAPKG